MNGHIAARIGLAIRAAIGQIHRLRAGSEQEEHQESLISHEQLITKNPGLWASQYLCNLREISFALVPIQGIRPTSPGDVDMSQTTILVLLMICAAGCGGPPPCENCDPTYADTVVEAPGKTGMGFGDATRAINGVQGAGSSAGSMDIYSLGYSVGKDNFITLRWSNRIIHNGPGPDLVIFENAFSVGGAGKNFMDQVILYLSLDGSTWVPYPHKYTSPTPSVYSNDPSLWVGFGGVNYVVYKEGSGIDPFNTAAAGGDAFDLEALPDTAEGIVLKQQGVRFIKLVTAPSEINPDTGMNYVREQFSNGADIDGVYGRYLMSDTQ